MNLRRERRQQLVTLRTSVEVHVDRGRGSRIKAIVDERRDRIFRRAQHGLGIARLTPSSTAGTVAERRPWGQERRLVTREIDARRGALENICSICYGGCLR